MADAHRLKSMFMLRSMMNKSVMRRKKLQTRRRRVLNVCFRTLLFLFSRRGNATPKCTRSCRRLRRNMGWFNCLWNTYSEERFKKTFRVSRGTFQFILRHVLERDTVNEDPISPECRLAICLYRLARGDYYYTISETTGLGVSTVCTIVNEVTKAIVENLWDECATKHMPKTETK